MTFTVERVTPGQLADTNGRSVSRNLRAALPFDVEVEDESEERVAYESACACQRVFRLTDAAVSRLKKLELFRQALAGRANPCVCDCMGYIL